ncbi:MAG: hypothetical protein HY077_07805 [Elusimicrobia bacterium]|nr:hypothetical protein [Elusimicrobiota bacterium]
MTALCGAWVLSGARAEAALDPASRRAVLGACGTGLREILDGPLWLAAAQENLASRERLYLAFTGFLTDGETTGRLERLVALPEPEFLAAPPQGHYALIRADAGLGRLTLYRDLFGGAPLYYAALGELLLFSTHAKALLKSGMIAGGVDKETAVESVLGSDLGVIFGSRSLISGINELPPGQVMRVSQGHLSLDQRPNPFVSPREQGEPRSPRRLRADLLDATLRAVGPQRRIAVALSGGMDSSSVAALAVEVLGAGNVEAFTYEFDDPSHPCETPYAALVCRRLGIRQHIVRIDYRRYVEALPELFWRLEAPRLATGAWVGMSRALKDGGFERILTGDGLEIALGIPMRPGLIDALAPALSWIPCPQKTLRYWKARRFYGWPLRRLARLLHPGLEPPAPHSYHMLLCVLKHNELIQDLAPFYPADLQEVVRNAAGSSRVREAVVERRQRPLMEQFRHHHHNSYTLHRLFRSKQIAFREMGAFPVCPAFFLRDAPIPEAAGPLTGRELERAAVREDVPGEVLNRPKIVNQAIISSQWARKIAASLQPLAPETAERLIPEPRARQDMLRRFPRELALLGLWLRIFDSGRVPTEPPTLESLGLERLLG